MPTIILVYRNEQKYMHSTTKSLQQFKNLIFIQYVECFYDRVRYLITLISPVSNNPTHNLPSLSTLSP